MKKQNGITLIALVISIIVMLILAGITLNAVVGENGIITKAQNAKLTSEEATRRENLEYMLFEYNASKFLNEEDGLGKYLDTLVEEGKIDSFAATTDGDYAVLKYEGKTYELARQSENSEYYKVLAEVAEDLGDIDGNYILTQKTLDTVDNFAFEDEKSYIILDRNLTGDDFEFNIPDDAEVTIKVLYDMTIDNKEYPGRSAIELGDRSILNLYVYGKVQVNSSFGEAGQAGVVAGAEGGVGANAGIHVPESATLNLYGTGTLTAQGGDAGDGGNSFMQDLGGAGGGGAGAGIGGNGGKGGNAGAGLTGNTPEGCIKDTGKDGEAGENCGIVNIYNTLTVYAYGGAGGSGGADATVTGGTGAGGGYPAAGIGGGGAGGGGSDHADGGGGYSGGSAQWCVNYGINGNGGFSDVDIHRFGGGGGYLSKGESELGFYEGAIARGSSLGGQGGIPTMNDWYLLEGGSGGIAGKGGTIKVSSTSKIFAYNGNECTLNKTDEGYYEKPLEIYIQNGILLGVYKTNKNWNEDIENFYMNLFNMTYSVTVAEGIKCDDIVNICLRPYSVNEFLKTNYGQGIGSGAGYIELSNGTYTIDSNMN